MSIAASVVLAMSIGAGVAQPGAMPDAVATAAVEPPPIVLAQRKASVRGGVRDSKRHWRREIRGYSGGRYNPPAAPAPQGSPRPTRVAPPPQFKAAVPQHRRRVEPVAEHKDEPRTWLQWIFGL